MTIIERLGLREEMLKNKKYQITITHENENELIGTIKSKTQESKFIEYVNNKLYVNNEEKEPTWLTDFLFVCSRNVNKRISFARDEKFLDILVNDTDYRVRQAVARKGYRLDTLVNDDSSFVRQAVAKKGYGLDILINDKSWWVRYTVAKKGYGLNVLVNDEDWRVRKVVFEKKYGLDKLVNDESCAVKFAVQEWLNTNNMTLEEWKSKYPDRCVIGK